MVYIRAGNLSGDLLLSRTPKPNILCHLKQSWSQSDTHSRFHSNTESQINRILEKGLLKKIGKKKRIAQLVVGIVKK